MLVLSRKIGERVVVEGGITIQVLEVKGQRIRLGVEAPLDVAVWREELSEPAELVSSRQEIVRKPR